MIPMLTSELPPFVTSVWRRSRPAVPILNNLGIRLFLVPSTGCMEDAEDYPRTLMEFKKRFATAETCQAYLEQLRWPEGFECPGCHERRA
jgi:hypothetical protein